MNTQQQTKIHDAVRALQTAILQATGMTATELTIGVSYSCLYGTRMYLDQVDGVHVRIQEAETALVENLQKAARNYYEQMKETGLVKEEQDTKTDTWDLLELEGGESAGGLPGRFRVSDLFPATDGFPARRVIAVVPNGILSVEGPDAIKQDSERRVDQLTVADLIRSEEGLDRLAAAFTRPSGTADPTPKVTEIRKFVSRMCPKCRGHGGVFAAMGPLGRPGCCTLCAGTTFVYTDKATGEVICPSNEMPKGRAPMRDADGRGWCCITHDPLCKASPGCAGGRDGLKSPEKKCDECGGSGTYESPLTGKRSPCSRGCRP